MKFDSKTVEAVIEKLEGMGYIDVTWNNLTGFEFREPKYNPNRKVSLDYQDHSGQFVVSTVSSHWTTAEAQDFLTQLEKITKQAIELNKLLASA